MSRRGQARFHGVSILARPEGRAPTWYTSPVSKVVSLFQSSPDPKAGPRYTPRPDGPGGEKSVSILARPEGRSARQCPVACGQGEMRFNPRPPRRPGATPTGAVTTLLITGVSILARSEDRAHTRFPV